MVCSYEVADGMTRSEDLKSKAREATERGNRLDQLVDAMRQGTDQQSSELLARLRVGATIEDLLDPESRPDHFTEYIRNGELDGSARLERSRGEFCSGFGLFDETRANQTPGVQATTAEGSHSATGTSTTEPSYPFAFTMPPPRISPEDMEEANNPFDRSFTPS